MGATENRREGEERMAVGFEAGFSSILAVRFTTVSSVFTILRTS
jgi:hypothetical protein